MRHTGFEKLSFWENDGRTEGTAGSHVRGRCTGRPDCPRGGFGVRWDSAGEEGISDGSLRGGGREATVYRLKKGDVCVLSASCMISAISFDVQIEAETEGCLEMVSPGVFAGLMKENIYVENFVYRSAAERFSDVVNAVEQLLFLTLEQRLVTFLLDESPRNIG